LRFSRGDTRLRKAALLEARNAGAFVPSLRPSGAAVLAYAARVADELGENEGNVPEPLLDDGVRLVDDDDREAIVRCFETHEPDLCERLRRAIPGGLEHTLVAAAVMGAICDRRPVSRVVIALLEHLEPLPRTTAARLGLVLPSGAVWSIADAIWLLDEQGLSCDWDRWAQEVEPAVLERVEGWHLDRVRLLAAALERRLPYASLPRASRVVARDCGRVCRSDEAARATAGALLVSHATMAAGTGIAYSHN
jgi:hypothetical protein